MAWFSARTLEDLARLSKLFAEIDTIREDVEALGGIVAKLSDRLTVLEAQAQAAREVQIAREETLKAQVETIALREVQAAVNAVQGGFHQRLADVRLEIDRLARPQIGD